MEKKERYALCPMPYAIIKEEYMRKLSGRAKWPVMIIMVVFLMMPVAALAAIDGVSGGPFNLTAAAGHISTPDGNSIYMWGYGLNGAMQYPGPTLIVNQGASVTVNLTNSLSVPVSIVFPGQSNVSAIGGVSGLLAQEAPPNGGTVTYTFTASQPGTYIYYSGSQPELQIEMGLVGALIVRPSSSPATQAYNHVDSQFNREYLFLLSEMDPIIHENVEAGMMDLVDFTKYFPVYWFINGRAAPDTMAAADNPLLPTQPYNCMPMMHPGERVLMRMIGAGRDMHPFHTHGNHHKIIARDGRLLSSGTGADLAEMAFTTTVVPGSTSDAIFTWTGDKLGWDLYGHTGPNGEIGAACTAAGVPMEPGEYEADHCKPFPVILPGQLELTFGQFYSGSPFLGALGSLPPGEGGFNPTGGFFFMWHSHAEKEITNFDIFPGGMLTMMLVEHPNVMFMNP